MFPNLLVLNAGNEGMTHYISINKSSSNPRSHPFPAWNAPVRVLTIKHASLSPINPLHIHDRFMYWNVLHVLRNSWTWLAVTTKCLCLRSYFWTTRSFEAKDIGVSQVMGVPLNMIYPFIDWDFLSWTIPFGDPKKTSWKPQWKSTEQDQTVELMIFHGVEQPSNGDRPITKIQSPQHETPNLVSYVVSMFTSQQSPGLCGFSGFRNPVFGSAFSARGMAVSHNGP